MRATRAHALNGIDKSTDISILHNKLIEKQMIEQTEKQTNSLLLIRSILVKRFHKNTLKTLSIFKDSGFDPEWNRVKWVGGIGSCQMMRGRTLRVQISASISGFEKGKTTKIEFAPALFTTTLKPSKITGYRYAYCINIPAV